MKNVLLLVSVLASFSVFSQLSPIAQNLYTIMYNSDPFRGNYAVTNGATFHNSPDSSSFYLQWFPNSSTQPDTLPMIVTCHGSEGKVFDEFYLWHSYAVANNCGIIAVQWFNPDSTVWGMDSYLKDTAIYNTIESALSAINYPSNKALFHGFSRGSARSYAINLYDHLSSNNYFCTTISNSGAAEPNYTLYHDIDLGVYGMNPFLGRRWALYCGELDPNPTMSGCIGMSNTKNWLISKGAIVDVYIQDPTGNHGGFHMNSANVDSIMTYYLQCFNSSLYVKENLMEEISLYPNPAVRKISIDIPNALEGEIYTFELYDLTGKLVYKDRISDTYLNLNVLDKGMYNYFIVREQKNVKKGKLVLTED